MARKKMEIKRRQYLRPWLEETLNTGRVPGVEWIDKKDLLFKIPWKRNSEQTRPEDFQIFREWAYHTGRTEEEDGSSGVYTKWKTRLRCAIHKAQDIKEEKDLHEVDPSNDEPFKVYRFLRSVHGNSSPRQSPPSSCDDSQDSICHIQCAEIPAVVQEFNEQSSPGLPTESLAASATGGLTSTMLPTSASTTTVPISQTNTEPSDMSISLGCCLSATGFVDGAYGKMPSSLTSMSGLLQGVSGLSLKEILNSNGEVENISELLMSDEHELAPAVREQPSVTPASAIPELLTTTDQMGCGFTLEVFYYSQSVGRQEVSESCQLFHGDSTLPEDAMMARPADFPRFEVPQGQETNQGKQYAYLKALLNNMSHGFIVECDSRGDIYVTRYCQVGVFAEIANSVEIKKLERCGKTKVFDQENFDRHLTDFNNAKAKRPSCEALLVFGQKPGVDRMKYLMYVTLTSRRAAMILEQQQSTATDTTLEMSVSDEFVQPTNGQAVSMDTS